MTKLVFGVDAPEGRHGLYVTPQQAADIVTTDHFDGETYSPDRDHDRLAVQLGAVRRFMGDYKWHTLREISEATGHPEASVSARIRDLRKPKHGGHSILRKYVERGLWAYQMEP